MKRISILGKMFPIRVVYTWIEALGGSQRVSVGVREIVGVNETKDGWYPEGIIADRDLIE